MTQLADLFSVPEMSLLCNITEFFEQNNIHFHPEILFQDVKVKLTSYILKYILYGELVSFCSMSCVILYNCSHSLQWVHVLRIISRYNDLLCVPNL